MTGAAIDPQAAVVLDEVARRIGTRAVAELDVDEARALVGEIWSRFMPEPPLSVSAARSATTGPYGLIPMTVLNASQRRAGSLAYFHGGGWTLGSAQLLEPVGALLSAATGREVVLVDYRLAPEHPYPVAVVECTEAVRWIAQRHPNEPIAVIGESAGASLAVSVALRLRDSLPIDLQVLLNPALDPAMSSASYAENGTLELTQSDMEHYWRNYLGSRMAKPPADAAPLAGAELSGLPPAVVVTSELDPLRDEGEQFARLLEEAGVAVTSRRLAGQPHSAFWMTGAVTAARDALDWVGRQIDLALAGSPSSRAAPAHP